MVRTIYVVYVTLLSMVYIQTPTGNVPILCLMFRPVKML